MAHAIVKPPHRVFTVGNDTHYTIYWSYDGVRFVSKFFHKSFHTNPRHFTISSDFHSIQYKNYWDHYQNCIGRLLNLPNFDVPNDITNIIFQYLGWVLAKSTDFGYG